MTLNSAINSALSGLSMASRATLTVASNVANATTEGYARRELETVSRDATRGAPGVRVVTENRILDVGLLAERRRTDAALAEARTRADALSELERSFGVPGEPGALVTRIGQFEAALIEAASRPDSVSRLETVLREAQGLAGDIGALGRQVQDMRTDVDVQLEAEVKRLNDGLAEVHRLNTLIQREMAVGQVPNGLKDQRQRVIDELADLVPLREVERPGGRVVLFTDNGGILLDGRPAVIEVTGLPRPVTAGAALAADEVALRLNGEPISEGPGGMLSGGRIEALFHLRDTRLPQAQASLDALAVDLIDRFAAADPTVAGRGLFIDSDLAPPHPVVGLAQRLAVAPEVAGETGSVLRLRTGLGGTLPGFPGDGTRLDALARALQDFTGPIAGGASARDFAGHAAEIASRLGRERDGAEVQLASVVARNTALRDSEAGFAVDTDAEMQRLLILERLYAANARVLTAADEMMQRLLAI
ncbi:MAG: flagellar hook-associated protein FlgK [Alkalilacustris sp.]